MADERWLPIPGYAGLYEVSDLGRVRSLDRTVAHSRPGHSRRLRGRVLTPTIDGRGYPKVVLCKLGTLRERSLHQLVLEAFVGPRPCGFVTRHINGDNHDARLTNLAYGTQSENMHDRVRHGNNPNAAKLECPQGHAYFGENLKIGVRGQRICRACQRNNSRAYRERKRAAAVLR